MKSSNSKLAFSLFLLRISTFFVLGMWTLDKFLNPQHGASIFERYYQIPGLSITIVYVIGTIQAVVILAFLVGFKKRLSYGLILLMHAVSTVSAWNKYLDPWVVPNLLFFAAFPMLAAIAALYLLRDEDTYLTVRS
ncbi:MAG: hypothetical protein K0U59_01340 [Gammaproteobacteria bacterium]|nr:hypothetical protein [Gammaproteobacteria bacterium]